MIDDIKKRDDLWKRFTRDEEYDPSIVDMYGRFPYYASKERNITIPSVSKYLFENNHRFEYPEQKKFAVCLTHDVDVLMTSNLTKIKSAGLNLLANRPQMALSDIVSLNSHRSPLDNIEKIIELENNYGAKSTFFFMALEPGERDFNYRIEDVSDDLRLVLDAGFEVGLHGGHDAYADFPKLLSEKTKLEKVLGQPVKGYRNHYLRFKTPTTWENLAKAGFRYDSTLGYADMVGFRNGMCHPFKPYNLNSGMEMDILEIPLVVMDCTLDAGYMRLDSSSAWDMMSRLVSEVESCNGVFTILWHGTYMSGEYLRLYQKFLKYCMERGAWITCGSEIADWYSND